MSAEPRPYNPLAIKAWALLSVIFSVAMFGLFIFNGPLTYAGRVVWELLRWIARPII
jgi:hypothetical protein